MDTKKVLLSFVAIIILSLQAFTQTITVNTPSGSPFCGGDIVPVKFTITGTFNSGNIFYIEMSDGTGSFASPEIIGNLIGTAGGTAITTIPITAPTGTGYRFRVQSTDPVVTSSNITAAISISPPGGTEGTYGNGNWYVSVYRQNDFTSYGGFFETGSDLDFNTTTYFPVTGSPADYASFDGCLIPDNNFSMSFRRRNFVCGYYQIDIPTCNNTCELIIDGTTVSSGWQGLLGPNSQVELKFREFSGDAEASLDFTTLPFALTTNSPVVKCSDPALFSTLTVSAPVTLDYTWSPATFLSATTGATVTSNANGGDITYTVTGTDAASGCSFTTTVDVNMAPVLGPLTVNVSPATPIICPTDVITLTATGAANYTWESWNSSTSTWETPTTLSATTGASVIASPTVTTEYRVTGDDGCGNSGTQTVTVVVGAPASVDDTIFGDGVWRAYAYNGDLLAGSGVLTGVYEQTPLSFNSEDAWNDSDSPSDAPGYIGCLVSDNNHSVSYKRTNFPCDFYQIDINRHDDDYELYIDGVLISSGTGSGNDLDVWRGILHADSEVEFRWQDNSGNSEGRVTITAVEPLVPTSFTIPQDVITCPRTINLAVNSNNFNPLPVYATTYEWTENGSINIASGVDNISQVPTTTTTSYEVMITQTLPSGGTCVITDNVSIIQDLIPDVSINPASATTCPASPVTLTASSPTLGVTYTWSPATGLNTTTGAIVIASPTTTTTYTVTVDDGCNTNTATATVTVAGVGDPSIFPDGFWRAYVYDEKIITNASAATYFGFYEQTGLGFDSRSEWSSSSTPSNASGYTGCPVGNDHHSVSYKRKNFPCGLYRMDINYHDDWYRLYVDGVLVSSHDGCCITHTGVWTGFLGPTSEVELVYQEWVGGSGAALDVVDIGSTLTFASPDITICTGTSATLTANIAAVSSTTYAWTIPAGFTASATTGGSITLTAIDGGTNTPNGVYTITCTATDPTTGCTLTDDIEVTVDPLSNTAVTSDDSDNTICLGESVVLTATGANTYTWSATPSGTAGMSATTGSVITITPTAGGSFTYTTSGTNNCDTKDASIVITVLAPTLPANTFGDGKWNVFVYDGDLYDNNPPYTYVGHYEETSLSFDSRNRWGNNDAPSDASGYIGCPVDVNGHSVSYKRTNFDCGFYVISIPSHDDDCVINIDIDGDGSLDFTNTFNGCCASHPNIWSGLLDANSEVEFFWREGSGGSHGEVSIASDVSGATTSIWTGDDDNDWFNPNNWCPDVPNSTKDAIIPGSGITNFPQIDFSTHSAYVTGAECKDLRIETGATLTFTNTGEDELDIYGDLKVDGTFSIADNTTIYFMGTVAAEITGTVNPTFYNVNLAKSSATDANRYVTLQTNISIKNEFTIDNSALALNGHQITIQRTTNDAINRLNNGYVDGETNLATNTSQICWQTGNNTDAYVFPFGVSFSEYIPVTFDKQETTDPTICVATRGTSADNLPVATGTNMLSVHGGGPAYLIDRWWDVESSIDPIPGLGAHLTLSYRGSENTLPAASANEPLAIQHFDAIGLGDWEEPYPGSAAGVTSGIGSVTATNLTDFSPHVITLRTRPLPITLLSFEGIAFETNVLLDWVTVAEFENDFYTIERSEDASRYEELGTTPAKNEILIGPKAYEFIDNNPYEGINYYRLKQTDFDGHSTYTNPIAIFFGDNNERLIVFPNPNQGRKMQVIIYAPESDRVPISIFNNLGVLVFEGILEKEPDTSQWDVELEFDTPLSAGTYHIQAITGKQVLNAHFVVN